MTEKIGPPSEDPLPQQLIEVDPKERDLFLQAFTSEPFRALVTQGAERVRLLNAESGFSVVTNGSQIVFSPMQFGTGHWDDISLAYAGGDVSTKIGLLAIDLPFGETDPFAEYKILGTFHSHLRGVTDHGFTQTDIRLYEDLFTTAQPFWPLPNFFDGVFMSTPAKGPTMATKLFMYQGPAQDTRYQGEDFSVKSVARQQAILEQSGFKVVLSDIPTSRRSGVNLQPLARALRAR